MTFYSTYYSTYYSTHCWRWTKTCLSMCLTHSCNWFCRRCFGSKHSFSPVLEVFPGHGCFPWSGSWRGCHWWYIQTRREGKSYGSFFRCMYIQIYPWFLIIFFLHYFHSLDLPVWNNYRSFCWRYIFILFFCLRNGWVAPGLHRQWSFRLDYSLLFMESDARHPRPSRPDRIHHDILSIPGNQPTRSERYWQNESRTWIFIKIICIHQSSKLIVVTSQSHYAVNCEVFFLCHEISETN